jgi:hypothetical protein
MLNKEKTHGQSQICYNFNFHLKNYFVHFLVSNFDRRERKLLENGREREKVTRAIF